MSRFLERARWATEDRSSPHADWNSGTRRFRVLTVTNNKGGIGKTMIASNLAVYIRAMREDLPILVIGLDDQNTLDRMFRFGESEPVLTFAHGVRNGDFRDVLREGQYGVHYVPSCFDISEPKKHLESPFELQRMLDRTGRRGLVILDTKSDFEILTQNALAASDLTLVVVKDQASLIQAERIFRQLKDWGRRPEAARVLISMVDRRIKYTEAGKPDVLAHLISEIRRRDHPLLESFISHSPKIASLEIGPDERILPVLAGAPNSLVHRQLHLVAHDVLKLLDQAGLSPG